jgi:transcriptional regulator GlxA family with amidase domain
MPWSAMILPMGCERLHVVAAVLPAVALGPLELAAAVEMFGSDPRDAGGPFYELRLCGAEGRRAEAFGGFSVELPYDLSGLAGADTVIVMPFESWDLSGAPAPGAVLEAIAKAHARGARVASFCTGAFVLAAAGLLDGRRATTHWDSADRLAREYPSVRVDPKVLYVDEGDVLTSAGAAASIDLALHIVRRDHGAEVANAMARRAVVPPHRDGGQAQYVEMPVPEREADGLTSTLAWAAEHLHEPLTVGELAARAHMSPRTFARRFRSTTGVTPHQWLVRQRVLHAQTLLETSDEPVERIAHASGFGAASALRQHFHRALGTSPQAYRRTFRGAQQRSATGAGEAA